MDRNFLVEIIQNEFLHAVANRVQNTNPAGFYYLQGTEQLTSLESTRSQDKRDFMLRQLKLFIPFFWNGESVRRSISTDEENRVEQIWRDFNNFLTKATTSSIKPGIVSSGRPKYTDL